MHERYNTEDWEKIFKGKPSKLLKKTIDICFMIICAAGAIGIAAYLIMGWGFGVTTGLYTPSQKITLYIVSVIVFVCYVFTEWFDIKKKVRKEIMKEFNIKE